MFLFYKINCLTHTHLEEEMSVDEGSDGLKLERASKRVLRGRKKILMSFTLDVGFSCKENRKRQIVLKSYPVFNTSRIIVKHELSSYICTKLLTTMQGNNVSV